MNNNMNNNSFKDYYYNQNPQRNPSTQSNYSNNNNPNNPNNQTNANDSCKTQ